MLPLRIHMHSLARADSACVPLAPDAQLLCPASPAPTQLIGTWTYLFSDGRPFNVSESTVRLQEGEEEVRRS